MNETEISRLLEEGLRFYAVGDPSRALEAWFKVLEAEPAHPRALEYVEYVRKSYRVENDAASLPPIAAQTDTSPSSHAAETASESASVVELLVEVAPLDAGPAANPVATKSEVVETGSDSVAPPSNANSGLDDDAAVSPIDGVAADVVGSTASPVEATAELATSTGVLLVDQYTTTNTSSTDGEAWQVQVSHPAEPSSSTTEGVEGPESTVVPTSNWGVAATMDWGSLVDDSMTPSPVAEPSVAASPEALRIVVPEAETDAPADSLTPALRGSVQVSPLPSLADVVVDEPVEEVTPDPPVIAARWTTEASPAGAQDRAEHGGFEDAPLPEFNDWPVTPGGFAQQIRAGSVAVVEIPGFQSGPTTDGAGLAEAGPPPPEDTDGAFSTPSKPEIASPSLAAHEPAMSPLVDDAATPMHVDGEAIGAGPLHDVTGANDDTGSVSDMHMAAPLPSESASEASSTTAHISAPDAMPLSSHAQPATLLETSWGDLIDDDGSIERAPTIETTSSASGAHPTIEQTATQSDPSEEKESALTVAPGAPSMRLMPLEEQTPPSTKIVPTQEDERGPPPPNPSELQSEDGSAPVIRMEGMALSAPIADGPDADVLAFPTQKGIVSSTEAASNTMEHEPSEAESNAVSDAQLVDSTGVMGPFPSVEVAVAEASTPPTAQSTTADPSTSEQVLSVSDAQSEPTQESPPADAPLAATSSPPAAIPPSQFRALTVDAVADEPYMGVHRSSKVSDSSIVVNPAEEAKRVGVSESTPRATVTTTIVQDKPTRVLRFDSYEGDAAESSEGLPVTATTPAPSAPASLRVDLESDDTIRVTRPSVFDSEPAPSTDDGSMAESSPSTAEPVPGASATVAFGIVPTTGPDGKPASPWDAFSGESDSVDLDASTSSRSVFDDLRSDEDRQVRAESSSTTRTNALESFHTVPPVESAAFDTTDTEPVNQCAALMEGARELFALGDFSGSLELVEKVLTLEPDNLEAAGYLKKNEGTLLQMYASKLGDLRRAPRMLTKPDEVIWMNLHHRAGFLLSQVDGLMTYEDLAEISGMSRLETYRILADLVQNGVITS